MGLTGAALIGRRPWHMQASAADDDRPEGSRAFRRAWRRTGGTRRARSAMLHQLNPVRLGYIRDQIDQHWGATSASCRPLAGKTRGRRRLRRRAARRAAGPARRGGDRDRRRAREYRGGARACAGAGAGDRLSRRRRRGARRAATTSSPRSRWSSMSPTAPPSSRGWPAALADGRAADPLDPQPHRLVAAAAGRARRGHRPDPAGAPTTGTSSSRPTSCARCSATPGWRWSTAPASAGARRAASTSPTTSRSTIS